MKQRIILGIGVAAALFPGAASAMSVQAFLDKGNALERRGMMAMFSPDVDVLKAELAADGKAWRAQVATARPPVCAPTPVKLDDKEIRAIFEAVPVAQRATTDTRAAFIAGMNARYRCR